LFIFVFGFVFVFILVSVFVFLSPSPSLFLYFVLSTVHLQWQRDSGNETENGKGKLIFRQVTTRHKTR
jgi:hypothetical protein